MLTVLTLKMLLIGLKVIWMMIMTSNRKFWWFYVNTGKKHNFFFFFNNLFVLLTKIRFFWFVWKFATIVKNSSFFWFLAIVLRIYIGHTHKTTFIARIQIISIQKNRNSIEKWRKSSKKWKKCIEKISVRRSEITARVVQRGVFPISPGSKKIQIFSIMSCFCHLKRFSRSFRFQIVLKEG